MSTFTIIGAGYMGSAMAWPLHDNEHQVNLVGTHLDREIISSCQENGFHPKLGRVIPDGIRPLQIEQLGDVAPEADYILGGINSNGIHWFAETVGPYLKAGQTILMITKGLRVSPVGEIRIIPDVITSELPKGIQGQVHLAAIGGPCIAGELAARRQTGVVLGSSDMRTAVDLTNKLRTNYYHLAPTTNMLSLEICAALKNAYATAVGFSLGWLEKNGGIDHTGAMAHNLEAAIFATAVREMSHFLEILGGDPSFAFGYPGAGDLFVTCQGGRSSKAGKLLGSGIQAEDLGTHLPNVTLESVDLVHQLGASFPAIAAYYQVEIAEFPLIASLAKVILEKSSPDEIVKAAFQFFDE